MPLEPLGIPGVWLHTPIVHQDLRGTFHESFRLEEIESTLNRRFYVRQVNQSQSKRGVVRGIHFTAGPLGQAKYVTCSVGSILDFVVDLRIESPTFGKWIDITLEAKDGKALLISEGLGHGFLSLQDETVVTYLTSSSYDADKERCLNVWDPSIGMSLQEKLDLHGIDSPIFSEKDLKAPSLDELIVKKELPQF
jgi:dTDP-4-dehydrorhamnose 3,5-epimerase